MAHPYAAHRQTKVEHSRVGHMTKGYATGGAVHDDAAQDRAQIKKLVKPSALKVEGKSAKQRMDRPNRARGGRTNKGSTVNVIIAPQDGANSRPIPPAAGLAPAGVAPAAPVLPPRPPVMPPLGPVAGPMPGAGPMPMPPRKYGGRAYAKGGAVKSGPAYEEGKKAGTQVQHSPGKDDQSGLNRGKPITYKKGGGVKNHADGGRLRSESTEFEKARRDLKKAGPPVTIMEDFVGRLSPAKGQDNAFRDALREGPIRRMNATGPYDTDYTRKTGGPVEAPKKAMPKTPPHLSGGARGGNARLEKERRAAKVYAKPK